MKFFPLFRYARVMARLFSYAAARFFFFFLSCISLAVNYSIYYFRRMVLRQTDKQARKLTDEEYQHYLNRSQTINPILVKGKAIEVDRNIFLPGELTPENKHVNALWIGTRLSKMEMLTLQSFVDNGHTFHLWAYEKIENELPDGVIVEDANAVIPNPKIFRYKLLYEKGGWWTDMDVTCLKPLNAATPYFFRKHHDLELVGNVMKCPPKSALMLACYTEAAAEVDENNTDWHKPIEILNKHVFANQLQAYIFQQVSNLDMWSELVQFVTGAKPVPDHYFFIHWMNEEWRSREIDKNEFRYKSVLGEIMINAGLLQKPVSRWTFLNKILEKYDSSQPIINPWLLQKQQALKQQFELIKRHRIDYLQLAFRYVLPTAVLRINENTYYDKTKRIWFDNDGHALMYDIPKNAIEQIEANTNWRWNQLKRRWISSDGKDIHQLHCNHLKQMVEQKFELKLNNEKWQHWNGGVFLFDDNSHNFMHRWHTRTLRIFKDPHWKTRDQGTLIATVWQLGLQNMPTLSKKFNFIADPSNPRLMLSHNGQYITDNAFETQYAPAFIHIFHKFGKSGWEVWDWVESKLAEIVHPVGSN